jgi:hypothetical protein
MLEMIALLACLEAQIAASAMRQLKQIVQAFLYIPNRATMLGLVRWSEKGQLSEADLATFGTLWRYPNSTYSRFRCIIGEGIDLHKPIYHYNLPLSTV